MNASTEKIVRPVSTRRDRRERIEAGLTTRYHGKSYQQRRSNDNRRAIEDSRRAA